jgi:hypothetical protein
MDATFNHARMQQQGHNSNNVQIGHAGSGNTIQIQQSQGSFRDQPVQFKHNPNLDGPVYEKRQLIVRTAVAGAAAFLLPLIGLFADLLSIGTQFGLPEHLLSFCLIMISVAICVANANCIRAFLRRPKQRNEARYLGGGEFLCIESDDTYKVVGYTASCNVPGCGGIVHIVTPPPREKSNFGYVGTCSNSPRGHTYLITFDLKGYHHQFDWRPPEEKQKK